MTSLGILLVLGFLFTGMAIFFDFRKKMIPHWFIFISWVVGLGVNLSISFDYFLNSLIFSIIFFMVGFLISISGGWGGGDGKFLAVLGAFFHFNPVFFLLSIIPATIVFKAFLIYSGKDPGKISREKWLEKGVPYTPAFFLSELIFLLLILV